MEVRIDNADADENVTNTPPSVSMSQSAGSALFHRQSLDSMQSAPTADDNVNVTTDPDTQNSHTERRTSQLFTRRQRLSSFGTRSRRSSSNLNQSYDDLWNLNFSHLQNKCKTGTNYTSSMLRLLGKLCSEYERVGKTMTSAVEQELGFIHKYTERHDNDSRFLSAFDFLCTFLRDISSTFVAMAVDIKSTMIEPMGEWQKQCDDNYTSLFRKHENVYHRYVAEQKHLQQYGEKYEQCLGELECKFKLVQLLSAGLMPPSDHKTIKKSWHSPSTFNKSVSKIWKKARAKTKQLSTARLSGLSPMPLPSPADAEHAQQQQQQQLELEEEKNGGDGGQGGDDDSKAAAVDDDDDADAKYEQSSKTEIEHLQADRNEHIPLLYAVYKYSNTRNKLNKLEGEYRRQVSTTNQSMSQYEHVRKETMKSMRKLEIDRYEHSRKLFTDFSDIFSAPKFDIPSHESFKQFMQCAAKLEPRQEFQGFVNTLNQNLTIKKYIKPEMLKVGDVLQDWRSPYHLVEDVMHAQRHREHLLFDAQQLKVPFLFEYIIEHIDTDAAVADPDIFLLNAISVTDSSVQHTFTFQKRLHPSPSDPYVAQSKSDGADDEEPDLDCSCDNDDSKDDGAVGVMKVTDKHAVAVLETQLRELSECRPVPIQDHHHALFLLKLWAHKTPEPILPYYLYDRICVFQSIHSNRQRLQFVTHEILSHLSDVRLFCLARLVHVCRRIIGAQHEVTLIDLSYELSNVIVRNPNITDFYQLDATKHATDNIDDEQALRQLLDAQQTYKDPLPPSHDQKRAEMAFITYLLSNDVPVLNERKTANDGTKLMTLFAQQELRQIQQSLVSAGNSTMPFPEKALINK